MTLQRQFHPPLYYLAQMSSSLLRYSPTSAWLMTTTCVGSTSLHYCVVFMHIPKPRGMSEMLNTTTPMLAGVFSVILARCPFSK